MLKLTIWERIWNWIQSASGITFFPKIGIIDVIDILFIAYILYKVLGWFRQTRAWMLLKGLFLLVGVAVVSSLLQMNLTSWLLQNTMVYGVIALVIIFQPEIRRALERLGHGRLFSWFNTSAEEEKISHQTVAEIIGAMEAMAEVKTGALIVVEQDVGLAEYEQTGIQVDAVVSKQLLINIFEKNTPLHDGAVIISDNRVTYATCYLPLSDNMSISKELGTRHRAALGLSEVSDAKIFVVSEETGAMSMAEGGEIHRSIDRAFIMSHFRQKTSGGRRLPWMIQKGMRNGR